MTLDSRQELNLNMYQISTNVDYQENYKLSNQILKESEGSSYSWKSPVEEKETKGGED